MYVVAEAPNRAAAAAAAAVPRVAVRVSLFEAFLWALVAERVLVSTANALVATRDIGRNDVRCNVDVNILLLLLLLACSLAAPFFFCDVKPLARQAVTPEF